MSVQTARQQVYEWIRGEIGEQSTVSLPELTDRMVAHFSQDKDFITAWLTETLRPIAYDAVQRVVGATRSHVIIDDTAIPREDVIAAIKAKRPRWQAFMEHAGDRHIRLLEMRKADLLVAANEREQRGDNEYRKAALWRHLASELGENETVGERFTVAQIAAIANRLRVTVETELEAA